MPTQFRVSSSDPDQTTNSPRTPFLLSCGRTEFTQRGASPARPTAPGRSAARRACYCCLSTAVRDETRVRVCSCGRGSFQHWRARADAHEGNSPTNPRRAPHPLHAGHANREPCPRGSPLRRCRDFHDSTRLHHTDTGSCLYAATQLVLQDVVVDGVGPLRLELP